MCYSARVKADFAAYTREHGSTLSLEEFHRLYFLKGNGLKARTPKAMDLALLRDATGVAGARIRAAIAAQQEAEHTEAALQLEAQRTRLAGAEAQLRSKPTKAAAESARIATAKIAQAMARLRDLESREPSESDSRIFPGWYAPVMIALEGRRVVVPMRYQCRPADAPAHYDQRFPGTYNARRDSLGKFWRGQFGRTHGLIAVDAFFENVARHDLEQRPLAPGEKPQNMVLEFQPEGQATMLVACLYAHWQRDGEEPLWSFAIITDEPPPEILAAGHDRCIVQIQPEDVDAWLHPDPLDLDAQYAILDRRPRPFYGYKVAS